MSVTLLRDLGSTEWVNRVNRRERTRLGLSYSESMREGGEEGGYRGVGNDREMGMRGGSETTVQLC